MSTKDRDFFRSLTLGAPARPFAKKLVPLRDSSKPRVLEVELDEEGKPKLEQERDAKKKLLFDDDGKPVMREVKRYRHPPRVKEDGSPAMVEVREPGIKLRGALYKAAGVTADAESFDMAQLQVEAVVALTFVPDTNIKVFDEKDKPQLLAQPSGGFVDDLFEVIQPLMNAAKEEEVAKN